MWNLDWRWATILGLVLDLAGAVVLVRSVIVSKREGPRPGNHRLGQRHRRGQPTSPDGAESAAPIETGDLGVLARCRRFRVADYRLLATLMEAR